MAKRARRKRNKSRSATSARRGDLQPTGDPITFSEYRRKLKENEDFTGIQLEGILGVHRGKRVVWEGYVSDVLKRENLIVVRLIDRWPRELRSKGFHCLFHSDASDQLSLLKKGEKVIVSGLLEDLGPFLPELSRCEILQVSPPEPELSPLPLDSEPQPAPPDLLNLSFAEYVQKKEQFDHLTDVQKQRHFVGDIGKLVEWEGFVSSVRQFESGQSYVGLDALNESFGPSCTCRFENASDAQLQELQKGQRIQIRGILTDYASLNLRDCNVTKVWSMEDSLAAEPSVRKVDHPSSVWVNSAVLFREDLDKVISLMPKPIHISDKEHEYATLDDVRKTVGDTPRGLKIESGYPQRVSLTLENSAPWFVWLEGSSKEVARKAFLEIRDILECSRPKYSWMFAPATRIVLLSLTIIGLIAGGSAISQGVIGGGGWGIAIGVTSLALLVLSVAFDQSRFILVKEREYKRTHFFVRNRNKVTLVVVAAIATATITKGCDFTLSWINSKMNRPLGPAQNAKQDDGAKSKDASAGTIGPETTSPRKSR